MKVMVGEPVHLAKNQTLTLIPAISAVVIAIQMIEKYCKKLKYRRRVVLVTNGCGTIDGDDISEITKKITEDAIEIVVMLVSAGGFTRCLLIPLT